MTERIVRLAHSLGDLVAALRPDVLSLVLATTDTPARCNLLAEMGQKVPSGMASAARVAEVRLARLPRGPVYAWAPLAGLHALRSRLRVAATTAASRSVFGSDGAAREVGP